jgi:hypothetical protein
VEDLVQWLGEQLDEDERIAREAASKAAAEYAAADRRANTFEPPYDGTHWTNDYDHVFVLDPRPGRTRKVLIADCGDGAFGLTPHIARHDPSHVLREIDAKRRILAEVYPEVAKAEEMIQDEWHSGGDTDGDLLRLLALPYVNRPGYREEWRP